MRTLFSLLLFPVVAAWFLLVGGLAGAGAVWLRTRVRDDLLVAGAVFLLFGGAFVFAGGILVARWVFFGMLGFVAGAVLALRSGTPPTTGDGIVTGD
jgi:hypothetical protein